MKVFISQPMSGLTEEVVMNERERAIKVIERRHPKDKIEVIDNYNHNLPEGSHPLEYLGRDIIMLKDADLVFFVNGFMTARGCRCELKIAKEYGLNIETEYVLDIEED